MASHSGALPPSRPPTVVTLHRNHSAHSSTTSLSSEHRRVPGIRYPSVGDSRTASPSSSGATMDRLREENARLRLRAEEITTDSNRRVEMHVAEIRMLKEESKRLRSSIGQLEGERNKARQLAHEWHKFARYSSDLVKQEVRNYDAKLKDAHGRMRRLREENEELKQICFYLDAQRHAASSSTRRHSARSEEESDDQGCGSSDHSLEGGEGTGYCIQKEDSLRRICQREEETEGGEREQGVSNDRILNYIHSLESRIKHLEMTTTNPHSDSWRSSMTPDDDLTVMEREWESGVEGRERTMQAMERAQSTSTMTSSGTTFCSSEMDETMSVSSVYVDGSEPAYSHLEVRTLAPIEEERREEMSQSTEGKRLSAEVALSALLPPCIEPISSSTMALGRLRPDGRLVDVALRNSEESLGLRLPNGREPQSVSEAVDALRIRENRHSATPVENPYSRWSPKEPKYLSAL